MALSSKDVESVDVTFFLTIVFDSLNICVIDWSCVCTGATFVTSGMKLDGHDIIHFGFALIHITDSYSFDFSINDISLSFLISFYFLLFTT